MSSGGIGASGGLLATERKEEPATRTSTVSLKSKNGYDHVLHGLRYGDVVYLTAEDGTSLLQLSWNPITGIIGVTLPESNKYSVYPGHTIELPEDLKRG